MQTRWLKDFEFHINPSTWNTAQDLLLAGRVKNLREVEKHFWVAQVEDEDRAYETEIMITPNKIKAFTCECFTEGRRLMCAHVAASLIKVRQFLEQRAEERRLKAETQVEPEMNRLTVQHALENASLNELNEFVREYARRDRNFALALKTWFAGSVTEAENPYLLVLESVIPKSAKSKALREPDFRRLRSTLDDLSGQYASAISARNFRTAYQIASAILQKAMPMLSQTSDNRRDQLLQYCTTTLNQLIRLHDEALAPELQEGIWGLVFEEGAKGYFPPQMLREVLRFLSETAGDDAHFESVRALFDQTPHPAPPFVLFLFLAALARRNMPQAVIRVLDDYTGQAATLKDGLIQLYYLQYWDAVTPAAEHFLQLKIFNNSQRRELEDVLLFLAEKTGDRQRQMRLLRERFIHTGQFDYFERLKSAASDEWPAELDILLTELRALNDDKKIAAVLAAEGERAALAVLLEASDDLPALQRYEDLFLPEDKNFVRTRYTILLSDYLREHFGRPASAQVRMHLAGLLNKGETALVANIIRDLSGRFEERQTLHEELAELFPQIEQENGVRIMKIELWAIGKTSEAYLETGLEIFEKRLKNYLPFGWTVLPDVKVKTTDGAILKKEEGKMILSKLKPDDYLVLLDENGRQYTSVELANWMERRLSDSRKRLVLLIGGAFGFAPEVYARANEQLSLSKMTFSHQMVRLFLMEQLYRAMTILRNEPYHNQ